MLNELEEHIRVFERTDFDNLESVALEIRETLKRGNKVLICGNGGSAADAQHFAAELVGRFEMERKGLPCIALTTDTSILTAIANDYGYEQVFKRQVEALAEKGDFLIGISTSGRSLNVMLAIDEFDRYGRTLLLTGIKGKYEPATYVIAAESSRTARIQEVHGFVLHTLCGLIDG